MSKENTPCPIVANPPVTGFWTPYRKYITYVLITVSIAFLITDYFWLKVIEAYTISSMMAVMSGNYIPPHLDIAGRAVWISIFKIARNCSEIQLFAWTGACVFSTPLEGTLKKKATMKLRAYLPVFGFIFGANTLRIAIQIGSVLYFDIPFIWVHNTYIAIGTDLIFLYGSYKIAWKLLPEFEKVYSEHFGYSTLALLSMVAVFFVLADRYVGIGDWSILGALLGYG